MITRLRVRETFSRSWSSDTIFIGIMFQLSLVLFLLCLHITDSSLS